MYKEAVTFDKIPLFLFAFHFFFYLCPTKIYPQGYAKQIYSHPMVLT